MPPKNCDVLKYSLFLLKVTGQDPRTNKKKFLISTALYTTAYIICITGILVNFFYLDGNIILFVSNCEAFAVLTQTFGKALVNLYYKNMFSKLIKESTKFTTNECRNRAYRQKLDTLLAAISYMQKLFISLMSMAIILMMIGPFFTKQLPTGVWNIPGHHNLYIVFLIVQEAICPFYVLYTVSMDCLFLGCCVQLIAQLNILQQYLKDVSTSDDNAMYAMKQKWCINRHEYLLWYTKLLADTYSPILLLVYISISIVAFAEMYLLFQSNHFMHYARGALFLTAALVQLSFYCIPAEYVVQEILNVAVVVFESDWYLEYKRAGRSNVLYMIMRAQWPMQFSAAGLIVIEQKALLNVVKFAWSVCTLLSGFQNVQQNPQE